MYFQILDNKKNCKTIFYNNSLTDKFICDKMTHTWSYSHHLEDVDIEYAQLWAGGKSMTDVCPEHLKDDWHAASERLKAFEKSFKISKINLNDVCVFDCLPESYMLELYDLKNKISEHVFSTYQKPKNYNLLVQLMSFIKDISLQPMNVRLEHLNFSDEKVRNSVSKIKNINYKIKYDPWVVPTGRLATVTGTFPILSLNKELRSAIHPINDMFLELDYNAAEIRTMLGLLNQEQPDEDIHEWISREVFNSKYSREETKKKVFAWLYNPKSKNKKLSNFLNRQDIVDMFYDNGLVKTCYGREIKIDEARALNYVIQSTASDMFLTSAIKINNILKNKKSNVSFCVHDSLIIDLAKEDKNIINELISVFSETKFGFIKTNVSMGLNYGSIRKVK